MNRRIVIELAQTGYVVSLHDAVPIETHALESIRGVLEHVEDVLRRGDESVTTLCEAHERDAASCVDCYAESDEGVAALGTSPNRCSGCNEVAWPADTTDDNLCESCAAKEVT